jgi:hypothetical protein
LDARHRIPEAIRTGASVHPVDARDRGGVLPRTLSAWRCAEAFEQLEEELFDRIAAQPARDLEPLRHAEPRFEAENRVLVAKSRNSTHSTAIE